LPEIKDKNDETITPRRKGSRRESGGNVDCPFSNHRFKGINSKGRSVFRVKYKRLFSFEFFGVFIKSLLFKHRVVNEVATAQTTGK
jgi:hypothetical protein